MPKASLLPSTPWTRVIAAFNRHFDKPDFEAVKAVYGCFAAHQLKGQPCWPLLIGPPGSLKTALLMGLDGLPGTHIIDQITPKTFISGYKPEGSDDDERPAGLLFRIGDSGKIICPDFSTILAINRDHRASILSDLRRIYDGMLHKEYGTGHDTTVREWRGRITFMAAGTGDVDRHYSVFASLGERFVLIRWPRAGFEAAQRAIKQDAAVVKQQVCDVVHLLFEGLEGLDPVLPGHLEESRIPALGDFIGHCRSPVVRNTGGGREIIDVPEAESATRISQQLAQLAKGCALIDRRDTVNEADWLLVKRVAFDCLLPARRKVLDAQIWDVTADSDALPESTRRYAIEDLTALGVLQKNRALSPMSISLLEKAGLI